ncbi:MAG: glycoside hydrolase family 9 protein [Deltaproteobacteria bacterium]|nr:glycoside hydrolase family 9 protein [Deltaproteobacteria bacterium]MBN2673324.1 glycoside hydrolase family 9 protein [Deltaproteobacteria bacterium]
MRKMKNVLKLGLVAMLVGACGTSAPPQQNQQASVATVDLGNVETVAKTNPAQPGVNVPVIKVNTVGYATDWSKMVIFNVDPKGAVVKDASGKVVMTVKDSQIKEFGLDPASKDQVWQVDISELKTKGTYTVEAAEMKNEWYKSDPFVVDDYWKVQSHAVQTLVKSFYYQRTRTNIVDPYAKWNGHSYIRENVSHAHDDVGWDWQYYPEKKENWKDSADKKWWPGEQLKKGWFDAGNFDMYIDSTGISAQILLIAYNLAPELFKDNEQNIPESGNNVPDILDETTWALDWIMSLQQKDGGFRHSEAVATWTGPMPADEDKTVRWIRPESTSSTAKAVSVLAMASVIYKDFPAYAEMAKKYEEAAKLGWEWMKKHPEQMRWNPLDSPQPGWDDRVSHDKGERAQVINEETGEYLYNDIGARWAAAVEMWVRFRDKDALATILGMYKIDKFDQVLDVKAITTGSWPNVSRYGLIELAFDDGSPKEVQEFAKKKIIQCADEWLIPRWEKDAHKVVAVEWEYYWGFGANTAEKVHMLAMAAKLTGEKKYMEAARDNWHYLMGRNPNGYSLATGVGSKAPTKFYHLEWGPYADALDIPPAPGFALGGPNYTDLPALAPDMPAKALLWDNQEPTRVGGKPHQMWHWKQEELWDGGFEPEGGWNKGWWCVVETDLLYSADFTLAGIAVGNIDKPSDKYRAKKVDPGNLDALAKKYTRRPAKASIAKNSPGGEAGYQKAIDAGQIMVAKETVGKK